MSRRFLLPAAAAIFAVVMASMSILVTAAAFTESFTGAPATPLSFKSNHWEVAYGSAWGESLTKTSQVGAAQHGPNCEAPAEDGSVTHPVSTYADSVFQCKDHIMTTVPGGSDLEYGAIWLTPDQLVDLSGGSATIRFDVSTLSRSSRDWISVDVQGWDTQEQRVLDDEIPSAQGNPRNTVHIEQGNDSTFFTSDGTFHVEVFDANRRRVAAIAPSGKSWTSVLTPSAQTRSTVEVVLSRSHVKVWMPQYNLVWVDKDIPQVAFTQGVVSFVHHSYGPEKGEDLLTHSSRGRANTFHWDNVSISPSIPITIVHTDHRAAEYDSSAASRTFTLAQPAPANSYLRFAAMAQSVNVSFDGGPFSAAPRTGLHTAGEHPASYFMPVPQGATRMTFQINPALGNVGQVQNPTVFSRTGSAPTTATPTASPTATATPTASATGTVAPTATKTASPTATKSPTPTVTPATPTPTPTVAPPANSDAQCQALFRYRDSGRGVYREVWRGVNCADGALIEPVR